MTDPDPRVAVVRKWLRQHWLREHQQFTEHRYLHCACPEPWSEHPRLLLAAIDAADPLDDRDFAWIEMGALDLTNEDDE